MRPLFDIVVSVLLFAVTAVVAQLFGLSFFLPDWLVLSSFFVARGHGGLVSVVVVFLLALFFSAFHYAPPLLFAAVGFFVWSAVRLGARRVNLANPIFVGGVLFLLTYGAQMLLHFGFAWLMDCEPEANPVLLWPNSLGIAACSGLLGPLVLGFWQRLSERLFGEGHREVFILRQ